MLVLSRKETEAIQIDGGITIKVLEVRGGRVRLGIEAPESVRICRTEVIEAGATDSGVSPQPSSSVTTPRPQSTLAQFRRQSALR